MRRCPLVAVVGLARASQSARLAGLPARPHAPLVTVGHSLPSRNIRRTRLTGRFTAAPSALAPCGGCLCACVGRRGLDLEGGGDPDSVLPVLVDLLHLDVDSVAGSHDHLVDALDVLFGQFRDVAEAVDARLELDEDWGGREEYIGGGGEGVRLGQSGKRIDRGGDDTFRGEGGLEWVREGGG